ncbi:MAG: SPASM domain-containing protein [Burkholderiaceae bacterium]
MFTITAIKPGIKPGSSETASFHYDPHTSSLTDEDGRDVVQAGPAQKFMAVQTTSVETPAGKITPRLLKISLGLSCNYECEYCSQRFVPRAAETNKGDIEPFLSGLDEWVTQPPHKIEFWGGEPLVYIKTLRPLAEALKAKYPQAVLSFITNGSLLTPEINEWIDRMGFGIGLSHDGPGQPVRGPDPLDDPDKRAAILDLYRRLAPQGRMSFNAMMNRVNQSRAEVSRFFVELTGDPEVKIGEGSIVDAYDEGGIATSLSGADHAQFRRRAFHELRTGQARNMEIGQRKIQGFIDSLRQRRPSTALGQKCGMDRSDAIAVDLKGNVLTCQNVSSEGVAPNAQSHRIGHVADLGAVKLNTATHWSHRDECRRCPVLQLCAGACMFLEGPLWEATCNNSYSDNIVFLAGAIEFLTGYLPVHIEGNFREDRKDIWGQVHGSVTPPPARRVIPIVPARQPASV